MLFRQFSEPESLVELAHQDQAAVGSTAGTLEIDLERGVEGELEWRILFLTQRVWTSKAASSRSTPHKHRWRIRPENSLERVHLANLG